MALHEWLRRAAAGAALLGVAVAVVAAPPPAAGSSTGDAGARLQKVDADIAAARTRHATLQAKVAQMEKQDAARREQLDQRDARIAELQRKLKAAGVPVSGASAGH